MLSCVRGHQSTVHRNTFHPDVGFREACNQSFHLGILSVRACFCYRLQLSPHSHTQNIYIYILGVGTLIVFYDHIATCLPPKIQTSLNLKRVKIFPFPEYFSQESLTVTLRSKTHVMKLETLKRIPEDSLSLITKRDKGACLSSIDTTDCEKARSSLFGWLLQEFFFFGFTSYSFSLVLLFNQSIMFFQVPRLRKHSYISPIQKKAPSSDVSNYRPISITSIFCRVFEKLLRKHTLEHLAEINLIPDSQHGFVTGRSVVTNMLESLNYWTEVLDNKKSINVIYFVYQSL
ncbi:unnamed protein product [Haemonchus placei]|uniref:Reverse transcriptase domain-containing protein n=1 Tax=Haemonchus placei TaxID=6290 RepID=A0A0N4WQ11_HAEPC|nr:unnamed protein product [Haemonchus placei]